MELKYSFHDLILTSFLLLIVPYGIEISLSAHFNNWAFLLIVPYGIEINKNDSGSKWSVLLIVPYGIEIIISIPERFPVSVVY